MEHPLEFSRLRLLTGRPPSASSPRFFLNAIPKELGTKHIEAVEPQKWTVAIVITTKLANLHAWGERTYLLTELEGKIQKVRRWTSRYRNLMAATGLQQCLIANKRKKSVFQNRSFFGCRGVHLNVRSPSQWLRRALDPRWMETPRGKEMIVFSLRENLKRMF